jgi:hypothetical protein
MLQFAVVATVTLIAGFYIGRMTTPDKISKVVSKASEENASKAPATSAHSPETKPSLEQELESDEDDQTEYSEFSKHNHEECKLVLVVRTDLGMTKGNTTTSPTPTPKTAPNRPNQEK